MIVSDLLNFVPTFNIFLFGFVKHQTTTLDCVFTLTETGIHDC